MLYLYDEGTCASLRLDGVARAIEALTGLGAVVRPEFVRYWVAEDREHPDALGAVGRGLVEGHPDSLAQVLVRARVHDPLRRALPERQPTPVEIAAERRALEGVGRTSVGILYDAAVVQWLMAELMGAEKWGQVLLSGKPDDSGFPDSSTCPHFSVILTGRLLGTYSDDDHRWHAHTIVCGEPALISTSGLVQAPARPREYYQGQALATTRLAPREVVEAQLQQQMADRMLVPDDPRMTEVVVGYALQAIAFQATGSAFCPVPTCRLFNARRQEELIRAQLSDGAGLCPAHEALFTALRRATQ